MQRERKLPLLARWRRNYPGRYDAVMMVIYTAVVYGWAWGIGPLGRDYEHLASGGRGMPPMLGALWQFEAGLFGESARAYLAFNVLLLYASMLLLFRLTNRAVRGPWWLGTLAALLYMANPVHSEAVLNLSGMVDLVPCVLGLAALEAYAALGTAFAPWKAVMALALFGLAVFAAPANAPLVLVLALWEWLVVEEWRRSARRLTPFVFVSLAALYLYWPILREADFYLRQMWAPLYFILYPIGFLPESAQRFHEHSALGWLAGLTVAAIVLMVYWKARRPAILFGLLAVLALRLYPGDRPVDPVHLVGGGQLLFANALLNVGLVALFYRIMDHPRWRLPIVSGTTLLVAVLFMLMWRYEWAWLAGTREVQAFQAEAYQLSGERIGVMPDYRYRLTAPVCLSDSIEYDTLFSRAVPHASLLPLHESVRVAPTKDAVVRIEEWSEREGLVSVNRAVFRDMTPWPYTLAHPGGTLETEAAVVTVLPSADKDRVLLRVEPQSGQLPTVTLPGK